MVLCDLYFTEYHSEVMVKQPSSTIHPKPQVENTLLESGW